MARDALARAVAVSPRDRHLQASLRYCDGHLHRINGEARKARRTRSPRPSRNSPGRRGVSRGRRAATGLAGSVSGPGTHVHLRSGGRGPRRRCVESGRTQRLRTRRTARRAARRRLSRRAPRRSRAARDTWRACRRSATICPGPPTPIGRPWRTMRRAGDFGDVPRNLGVATPTRPGRAADLGARWRRPRRTFLVKRNRDARS